MFQIIDADHEDLFEVFEVIKSGLPKDPILNIMHPDIFVNLILKSILVKEGLILIAKNINLQIIGVVVIGNFTSRLLYKSLSRNFLFYPLKTLFLLSRQKKLLQFIARWLWFVMRSPSLPGFELCWIAVSDKYRNNQIGSSLLCKAESQAWHSGIKFIWLKTLVETKNTSNFYLKNNYSKFYEDSTRILYGKELGGKLCSP